ncbi:E3 ubiquitin/ISG15 ligase TRIM25 [Festucalex cinctus]
MASGQSILQELTCPVCLDVFREPYLLPCGHNFCKMCLNRLLQLTDQSHFHCPECRNSYRCNKSFQKNYKLANIALAFPRRLTAAAGSMSAQAAKDCLASVSTDEQECVPCDYCPPAAAPSDAGTSSEAGDSQDRRAAQAGAPASNMAVKMCLKCEVSMCPQHIKPHLELSAFRKHQLIEPRDFWKRKCLDHDEIFTFYCLDHQVCACNTCIMKGQHAGHKIKTLENNMIDIKQKVLEKQLIEVQKKYAMAKRMLNKQTEMEQNNKRFIEDLDGCLARLRQDLEEKMSDLINRLMVLGRTHCESSGPTIQKNITHICQELSCVSEVRGSVESLVRESDGFVFIESYKTKGKECHKLLKRDMFHPECVDLDRRRLSLMMEKEMQMFLKSELTACIIATINSICRHDDIWEESDENENMASEMEDASEADDFDLDDGSDLDDVNDLDDSNDLDDGNEEEMSGEEEEEEEEDDDDEEEAQEHEVVELSDIDDESYITEEEEDVEEGQLREEEDEDQEEGYDDVEED